jgi:hypothetical protein
LTKTYFIARPVFTIFPKDESVNPGSDVTFGCSARGVPLPSIFWTREGSQELMFPSHSYQKRYTIFENGSLQIKQVIHKDEGHYVCSAISQVGATTATVFLDVSFFFYILLSPISQTVNSTCKTMHLRYYIYTYT